MKNDRKTQYRPRPLGGSLVSFGLRSLLLILLVGFGLFPSALTAQQKRATPSDNVDSFYGIYQETIPIAVPPFRGLEPKIGLSYQSSSGNGLVGVGWNLLVGGWVERASRGKGAPRYDDSDIFLMGGQELVPCEVGSRSPSCQTGGTHSTKIESYVRIRYDEGEDTWTLTTKEGTQSTYTPVVTTQRGVFRYGLKSAKDTYDNVVEYSYRYEAQAPCENAYPESIAYNESEVRFFWEKRPDVSKRAIGGCLLTTASRLRTVAVTVSKVMARAYRLEYETSPSSGRSRLKSVQRCGRSAVLDSGGAITDGCDVGLGEAMPKMMMKYTENTGGFEAPKNWRTSALLNKVEARYHRWANGAYTDIQDINGDGKLDFLSHYNWKTKEYGLWVLLNKGDKFDAPRNWKTAEMLGKKETARPRDDERRLIDMNGDGLLDYVSHHNWKTKEHGLWVLLNNGSGFDSPQDWNTVALLGGRKNDQSRPSWGGGQYTDLQDINGDGLPDFLAHHNYATNEPGLWVLINNGKGFEAPKNWNTAHLLGNAAYGRASWFGDGNTYGELMDMDNDGLLDYVAHYNYKTKQYGLWVLINNGGGFGAPQNWNTKALLGNKRNEQGYPSWVAGNYADLQDINGDGFPDYVAHHHYVHGSYGLWVLLNNGAGFSNPVNWWHTASHLGRNDSGRPNWTHDGRSLTKLVDVNGDGLLDFTAHHNYKTNQRGLWVMLNTGSGFGAPVNLETFLTLGSGNVVASEPDALAYSTLVDMNGDRIPDYVSHYNWKPGGGHGLWILKNKGGTPDLLTGIDNGLGGRTLVDYRPSTSWPRAHHDPDCTQNCTSNPLIMSLVSSVTVQDGRGNSAQARYAYAGGLYDRLERRFLGFHYVKQVDPCIEGETACPYQETWFHQDYGSVSKPKLEEEHSGEGELLTATRHIYTSNGATTPYTSQETEEQVYVYSANGSFRASKVTRTYDDYGNVVLEGSYGDDGVIGDEKVIHYTYRPNKERYIVGKPAHLSTYSARDSQGTLEVQDLLAQTLLFYDGANDWETSPLAGKPTTTMIWDSSTDGYVTTSSRYDRFGNLVEETNALGVAQKYIIDETYHTYTVATIRPYGLTSSSVYDPVCGKQSSVTDANGVVTTRAYDSLCRLICTTAANGLFEKRFYEHLGDPNKQHTRIETPGTKDKGSIWTKEYFDGLGTNYRTESRGPRFDRFIVDEKVYDARGNLARTTAPYYSGDEPEWTLARFDALNRVKTMVHPDGHQYTKSYDLGSVTTVDELGHAVIEKKDIQGLVVERVEAYEGAPVVTKYVYDVRGNLSEVIDPAGNIISTEFDSLNRKIQISDPDGGRTCYEYDAAGQLVVQWQLSDRSGTCLSPVGKRVELAYDDIGRITEKRTYRADNSLEGEVQFGFDEIRKDAAGVAFANRGRQTSMRDGAGEETYDYDSAGNVVRQRRVIDSSTYEVLTGYDAAGRVLWTSGPGGDVGTPDEPRGYDEAGRINAIPGFVGDAEYTAWGALTRIMGANGVVTKHEYDKKRQWLRSVKTESGSLTVQATTYGRDATGKILSIQSPFEGESATYAYDELDRLTSAAKDGQTDYFAYDPIGNLTRARDMDYVYNASGPQSVLPHAVKQAGKNAYVYDAYGNMLSGAGRTLTWSVENQLLTANNSVFTYSGSGDRLKKVEGGVTTHYLGDDIEVGPDTTTRYIRLGAMLVGKRVNGTSFWMHSNHQGSVQAITDAAGTIVSRKTYGAYGVAGATTGNHSDGLGYTGQREDETGLIYLHARYYDPSLARFISADPTVPSARSIGLNRYAYAGNDPVNHTDIDGLGFFKKIKKKFKKFVKKVKRTLKKIGTFANKLAAKISKVPLIGGILATPLLAAGGALTGNWEQFARAFATMAIMAAAVVMTIFTAGALSGVALVLANAAVGFVSGFATAAVNGASIGQSLKAGAIGAAIAAGTTALKMAYDSMTGTADTTTASSSTEAQSSTPRLAPAQSGSENPYLVRVSNRVTSDTAIAVESAAKTASDINNVTGSASNIAGIAESSGFNSAGWGSKVLKGFNRVFGPVGKVQQGLELFDRLLKRWNGMAGTSVPNPPLQVVPNQGNMFDLRGGTGAATDGRNIVSQI